MKYSIPGSRDPGIEQPVNPESRDWRIPSGIANPSRHPRHAAINDIIKRVLTSAKFLHTWNPLAYTDLMETPFCHGSAVGFWLGMQPVLIRLLLLTQYWLLRKQALWSMKQRRGRQRNIPLFLPLTISFPSLLRLQ